MKKIDPPDLTISMPALRADDNLVYHDVDLDQQPIGACVVCDVPVPAFGPPDHLEIAEYGPICLECLAKVLAWAVGKYLNETALLSTAESV